MSDLRLAKALRYHEGREGFSERDLGLSQEASSSQVPPGNNVPCDFQALPLADMEATISMDCTFRQAVPRAHGGWAHVGAPFLGRECIQGNLV